MKNLIYLLLIGLFITGCCIGDCCKDENFSLLINEHSGQDFLEGTFINKARNGQLGFILLSKYHNKSFKILYKPEDFNCDKDISKNDKVYFKLYELDGIPIAKEMTCITPSNLVTEYDSIKTKIDLHSERYHHTSTGIHVATHIVPTAGYPKRIDMGDFFGYIYVITKNNKKTALSDYANVTKEEVIVRKSDYDIIENYVNKVFFNEESGSLNYDGKNYLIYTDFSKKHQHDNTAAEIIPN